MYLEANQIPATIHKWAGSPRKITLDQSGRARVSMPWHEADRTEWRFFTVDGQPRGEAITRSGQEAVSIHDYLASAGKDGFVDVPEGYILACSGSYPPRLELYSAPNAMKLVAQNSDIGPAERAALIQAAMYKSSARYKFPPETYRNLQSAGLMTGAKAVTPAGRNAAAATTKEQYEQAAAWMNAAPGYENKRLPWMHFPG